MERLILIETSTALCSAAICEKGGIIAYRESDAPKSHASLTAVFIDEMLKEKGLELADCDGVCVSMGPGSYTGLRVGVSTAKGLCFGGGLPLLAVGTLDTLVAQAVAQGTVQCKRPDGTLVEMPVERFTHIVPMIDARRMEVYTGVFSRRHPGMGFGMSSGQGSGQDSGQGSGQGSGMSSGQGSGMSSGLSFGQVSGPGSGMDSGQGSGLGSGQGSGMDSGQGLGLGSGQGSGMSSGLSFGQVSGPGSRQGSGLSSGQGSGLDSGQGSGMDIPGGQGAGECQGADGLPGANGRWDADDRRNADDRRVTKGPDFIQTTETEPHIVTPESFREHLAEGPVLFIGDGALKCADAITSPNAFFLQCCPKASSMAAPATEAFRKKEFRDVAYFEPFYLKEFTATVSRKKLF